MSKNEVKNTELEAQEEVVIEETENNQEPQEVVPEKKEANKVKEKKPASNKNKKNKQDKPRSNKAKEMVSELKKVSWPSFAEVVKKTGIVLIVVAFFFVVLFGIDWLLSLLYQLLTKAM